jgi:hypothetical protein
VKGLRLSGDEADGSHCHRFSSARLLQARYFRTFSHVVLKR